MERAYSTVAVNTASSHQCCVGHVDAAIRLFSANRCSFTRPICNRRTTSAVRTRLRDWLKNRFAKRLRRVAFQQPADTSLHPGFTGLTNVCAIGQRAINEDFFNAFR